MPAHKKRQLGSVLYESSKKKIARALKMVSESRSRMNAYTPAERLILEKAAEPVRLALAHAEERKKIRAMRKERKRLEIQACAMLASELSPGAAQIARRVFHELNKLTGIERQRVLSLSGKHLTQYL